MSKNSIFSNVRLEGMGGFFDPADLYRTVEGGLDAAGEIGWSRMAEGDGNSTYRNRIIDAIYNMDGATLNGGAKYELR